ncbi:N-acetylmuramoyl-L-alanine amidase [Oceanobacillus piezotolerans]|uniref:N-acetylmuramoyl-L-alanine amidase n=1 Tax=Oceanobacillus piezotolerans TaxID=2448030 RepID=A0A498D4A7_9BACI|nr:N-acetylmuramoyl-L-alanine amidase [Oceanobacillus piezotolerans]RLL42789.1 N-acetylmuramoyl-L-alanine amidase [Oceanobacillus piezotolerans]
MKQTKLLILFIILFIFFIPMIGHADEAELYEVHAPVLNVREKPAADSEVIGVLTKGNQLQGFQEKYGWVQTYYGGSEAWVAKHHLISLTQDTSETNYSAHSVNQVIIQEASMHIRSGPGTEYRVVASAFNGDSFDIIDRNGDWLQVSLGNGNSGWIASWLTDIATSEKKPSNDSSLTSLSDTSVNRNGALSGYTIVVDPGHGGNDSGAIGIGGVYEKNIVTSTANRVVQSLQNAGANVILTRYGDYYVSLEERVRISNSNYTDAFISIHYNAFPYYSVQGINTYYYGSAGRLLAQNVHASVNSSVPLNNRGIQQADYHVIQNTYAPAILMELGFITNPYDLSIVQTTGYQQNVANAITTGLINFFN